MATAATPKGSTHNVSTPKQSQISANQLAPNVKPPNSGGKAADGKATHRVSTPKKSAIPAGQRGPGQSPHA